MRSLLIAAVGATGMAKPEMPSLRRQPQRRSKEPIIVFLPGVIRLSVKFCTCDTGTTSSLSLAKTSSVCSREAMLEAGVLKSKFCSPTLATQSTPPRSSRASGFSMERVQKTLVVNNKSPELVDILKCCS